MTENQRLKIIMKELGYAKQKDFAVALNVQPGSLSDILREKEGVGVSNNIADKLEILFNVNKEWLKTGIGPVLFKGRNNILSEPNAQYNKPEVEYTPNMYIVPLRAWGGFLTGYERRVFDLEKVPFPLVKGECFAFEIDGFSMLKEYKPGDYFIGSLIEGFDWLIKGRDYVFQTINGLILKRFVKIEDDLCYMKSINDEYNPVEPMPLKEIKALYQREGVYNK